MLGFINLLKPCGLTSHAAVQAVRRLLGERQVGHLGTLDPEACGVLPLAVGRATRLIDFLPPAVKSYRAEALLGLTTTTQDLAGQVLARQPTAEVSPARVEEALAGLRGELLQVPPMYSAVHHQGRRLYELARAGREVPRAPRRVTIYRLEALHLTPGVYPRLLLEVTCSPGTYIRSLVADLGAALGCGATLAFLLRTASGDFTLEQSWTLEELAAARDSRDFLLPPDRPLVRLPAVAVQPAAVDRALHGNPVPREGLTGLPTAPGFKGLVRVYGPEGGFLGMGELGARELRMRRVLAASRS